MKALRWATMLLMAAALATALAACVAPTTFGLSGTVEYSQYDVLAETAGKVTAVKGNEVDAVHVGDAIAVLDSSVQETGVQQAQAVVDAKQAKLDELKSGSRPEQIAQATAAVQAAQAKYDGLKNGPTAEQVKQAKAAARAAAANRDAAKKTYSYAKGKYDDALKAFNAGTLSQSLLDDAKNAMDKAYGAYRAAQEQYNQARAQQTAVQKGATAEEIEAAKANLDQAKAQLALTKAGSTSFTITAAQKDLEAAQAQLQQAKLLRDRCTVKAPVDGVLAIVNAKPGSMLNAGGYAATIAVPDDLWMYVYVPQSKLKAISLNQELSLGTTAWPGASFKGIVTFLATEAEFTPKNTETDESKENTVFKVKVRIEDPEHKLRAGMTMNAVLPLK